MVLVSDSHFLAKREARSGSATTVSGIYSLYLATGMKQVTSAREASMLNGNITLFTKERIVDYFQKARFAAKKSAKSIGKFVKYVIYIRG